MISQLPLYNVLQRFWPRVLEPTRDDKETVARIQATAAEFRTSTDAEIKRRVTRLRKLVKQGEGLTFESVVVPSFALVVEALRRTIDIALYDVQLLAGLVLSRPAIAEMQTGEGKTFAATLPAFIYALAGKGVHVMTVNNYLAKRDYELLRPAYRLLGFSTGLVEAGTAPDDKRKAYESDITYGPGYEFGFDYLRDQTALLAKRKPRLGESFRGLMHGQQDAPPVLMQRGHAFAILDEVDSVLLDEATTPLVLSQAAGSQAKNADVFRAAAERAARLQSTEDFIIDPATGQVRLTHRGINSLTEESADVPRRGLDRPWNAYVEQALRAQHVLQRDVEYVVLEDKVMLVDQYTGRIFSDRSWRDGLQQAVEAKENVTITPETQSAARITRQRYFRLYDKLCGMTGTAQGSEREFQEIYKLGVVTIPTRKPSQRKTLKPRFFVDSQKKLIAIADEIAGIHESRRPILVGTRTIEDSETLSLLLDERNVRHQVLNGKQDEEESRIIARAGIVGTVTIATNMAGRGTDIKLGPGVAELGGLHVVVCEPQESARVDRQLIGRAARQGDPGSARQFTSADDRVIKTFAATLSRRMKVQGDSNGEVSADCSEEIARLQRRLEGVAQSHRRQMFAHDDWLECMIRGFTAG